MQMRASPVIRAIMVVVFATIITAMPALAGMGMPGAPPGMQAPKGLLVGDACTVGEQQKVSVAQTAADQTIAMAMHQYGGPMTRAVSVASKDPVVVVGQTDSIARSFGRASPQAIGVADAHSISASTALSSG